MENIENAQSRLTNIETVAPILAALRTISLGSWQIALNRRGELQRYSQRLLSLLPTILPHLDSGNNLDVLRNATRYFPQSIGFGVYAPVGIGAEHKPMGLSESTRAQGSGVQHVVVLVIGSERGLCGRYNAGVQKRASEHLDTLSTL
jgi:hypothetical protein